MKQSYHVGCLKVLRVLNETIKPMYCNISWLACQCKLSESGAAARFRQLRTKRYGCTVECKQIVAGVWVYRLVHAPKRLLEAARKVEM